MASLASNLLDVSVHRNEYDKPPPHHVVAKIVEGFAPYLTNWNFTQSESRLKKPGSRSSSLSRDLKNNSYDGKEGGGFKRTAFVNPWPSWHSPTRKEVWDSLEWGEDQDPCIQLALSRISQNTTSIKDTTSGSHQSAKIINKTKSRAELAAELLGVQTPDFAFDPASQQAKATWLGHAGVLVQLPPLQKGGRPVRCIFDPIFSNRSSPTQTAGPIRSYPPPCKLESLPPIDVFMMSHNHHDHLDYDTVMPIWKANKDWIRFVVPLGNKSWFTDCGIDEDRVIELDWWEHVELSQSDSKPLKITCTPCQHNSGRTGSDANQTLWSSWYLEHPQPEPYRVYFAGDTGYQFHGSSDWPPSPFTIDDKVDTTKREYNEKSPSPTCPAFEEVADRLGTPDLSLLPVAVGATFSYLRSFIPLPDSANPFPRHRPGVTAANHMPPWDAVHVFRLMINKASQASRQPVAIAMHWGTFVPERGEVLKTLGQLEYACIQRDIQFGRSMEDIKDEIDQPIFLALNHGHSVTIR